MLINYISTGSKSNNLLNKNIDKSFNYIKDYPINIISDIHENSKYNNVNRILFNSIYSNPIKDSRYVKTNLNNYTCSEFNLYLDSDTIVMNKGIELFNLILNDGFDLIICPSTNQDENTFWHIENQEKQYTLDQIGYNPLQLQCGVLAWRKNLAIDSFFNLWYAEWRKFEGQDQAAFVRALDQQPIKYYVLSNVWNGGYVIKHEFGSSR